MCSSVSDLTQQVKAGGEKLLLGRHGSFCLYRISGMELLLPLYHTPPPPSAQPGGVCSSDKHRRLCWME